MKFGLLLFLTFNITAFTLIQDERANSSITFRIVNAGIDVNGTLKGINSEIKFIPEELNTSYINATAQVSTINTGIPIRDTHLKRSDYFDAVKYPLIQLRSKQIQKKGRNQFKGIFELTIKNITKEITIPISLKQNNTQTGWKSFSINRLDFQLGEESSILDSHVYRLRL